MTNVSDSTSLYEMQLEGTHLNIILSSLSCYMQEQYRGIELGVVDVNEAMEEIKVASDIQLVLKHQLGKTRHTPKQTSQHTGLIWCKEINLDEYCDEEPFEPFNDEQRQKELNDSVEYAKQCLDTFIKNQPKYDTEGGILTKAWNNVKERHWDTIKRIGNK